MSGWFNQSLCAVVFNAYCGPDVELKEILITRPEVRELTAYYMVKSSPNLQFVSVHMGKTALNKAVLMGQFAQHRAKQLAG